MLQSDIFVFDHGVHYNKGLKNLFTETMAKILQTASRPDIRVKLKLLAWRQTTAQHFNASGGHFSASVRNHGCQPMYTELEGFRLPAMRQALKRVANFSWTDMLDTQHVDLEQVANKSLNPEVVILPFRDFTRHMHDFHPVLEDCTHYCHTPFMWLPIWRSLRLAVDRAAERET